MPNAWMTLGDVQRLLGASRVATWHRLRVAGVQLLVDPADTRRRMVRLEDVERVIAPAVAPARQAAM